MFCPSPNPSVEQPSVEEDAATAPSPRPYDNALQHRTTRPEHVAASTSAVIAHRQELEAAMAHKAKSSDRFLQSAQEREAMVCAAAVRDELRAASARRAENAATVMHDAARTRARHVDYDTSNSGCEAIWDFGCPVDIFQAACDGDVEMIHANLAAAASEVERAVVAQLGTSTDHVSEAQLRSLSGSRRAPDEDKEDEKNEVEVAKARQLARARAAAIAASPRVALAANLINAVGQPHASTYAGAPFEKRWNFQAPPLALAAAFNRERAVKALLACGAEVSRVSSTGLTALDYAEQRGYGAIVEMLATARQQARAGTRTSDLIPNSDAV